MARLPDQNSSGRSTTLPWVTQELNDYLIATGDASKLDFEHAAGLAVSTFNGIGGPLATSLQSFMQSGYEEYRNHLADVSSVPAEERAASIMTTSPSLRAKTSLKGLTETAFVTSQAPASLAFEKITETIPNPLTPNTRSNAPSLTDFNDEPIWFGWACDRDGNFRSPTNEIVFRSDISRLGEGESEDPSNNDNSEEEEPPHPLIVQLDAHPNFVLANLSTPIDAFQPDGLSSGTFEQQYGSFTSMTDPTNAPLDLPGVSWSHIVSIHLISNDQWSISETFVLAYNLSQSQNSGLIHPDDDPTGGEDNEPPQWLRGGQATASFQATRSGYIFITLQASRGIQFPAHAGVVLQFSSSYLDIRSLTFSASGSGSTTLNPLHIPSALTEPGNNNPPPPPPPPTGYNDSTNWSFGFGTVLTKSGSLNMTVTPLPISAGNSTVYGTDFVYDETEQHLGQFNLTSSYTHQSSSGNGALPVPPGGEFINTVALDTTSFDLALSPAEALANQPPIPLPPPTGNGHSLAVSQSSSLQLGGDNSTSSSLRAKFAPDESITEAIGQLRDQAKAQIEADGADNYMITLSMKDANDYEKLTTTLTTGKNSRANVGLSLENDYHVEVGLDSNQAIAATENNSKAEIGASVGGTLIEYEVIEAVLIGEVNVPPVYNDWDITHTEMNAKVLVTSANADAASFADAEETDSGSFVVSNFLASFEDINYVKTANRTETIPNSTSIDGQKSGFNTTSITLEQGYSFSSIVKSNVDVDVSGEFPDSTSSTSGQNEPEPTPTVSGGTEARTRESLHYYSKANGSYEISKPQSLKHGTVLREGKYDVTITRHLADEATVEDVLVSEVETEQTGNDEMAVIYEETTGDSQVVVTGNTYDYLRRPNNATSPGGPGFGSNGGLFIQIIEKDLATGVTTIMSPLASSFGDEGGGTNGWQIETITEPDYDPRHPFERYLDGSRAPAEPLGSNVNLHPEFQEATISDGSSNWLDRLQLTLDVAGFAPGLGMAADVANAGVSLLRGNYADAAVNLIAVVPLLGDSVKAAKMGVKALNKASSKFDEMGKCANLLTTLRYGGCFVAGTLVTVSELPHLTWQQDGVFRTTQDWNDDSETSTFEQPTTVAAAQLLKVPIEAVPLGARVPTKNPRPWEYDDTLPEPDQATWAKVSITMHRNDGGIVDAELLRPRWWIAQHNIVAGKLLPMNIEELQVHGSALVTAIDDCPEIAPDVGWASSPTQSEDRRVGNPSYNSSVVTARFCTREVHTLARAEILGPAGQIEMLEGTTVHPIWSLDRDDWVPLSELQEGEQLQCQDGTATVLSLALVTCSQPVYNIEVHGEHVYEVGDLGLLVHNACEVLVSRWGREGLENGDWVMKGAATRWNYWKSFKWEPPILSDNIPAAFNSGREYVVNAAEIVWPKGWGKDGWWKGLFGQRIYIGPGL